MIYQLEASGVSSGEVFQCLMEWLAHAVLLVACRRRQARRAAR